MRSVNGGCSWATVFAAGDATRSAYEIDPFYKIVDLAIPDTGLSSSHQYVYVVLAARTMGGSAIPTIVGVSRDGGRRWSVPDPLPSPVSGTPSCDDAALSVAPSRPATVYLRCHTENDGFNASLDLPEMSIDVSTNAGRTWSGAPATGFSGPSGGAPRRTRESSSSGEDSW